MDKATYKIIRCEGRGNRGKTVVATQLPFQAAKDECDRLDAMALDGGPFTAAVHVYENTVDADNKQGALMERALSLLSERPI